MSLDKPLRPLKNNKIESLSLESIGKNPILFFTFFLVIFFFGVVVLQSTFDNAQLIDLNFLNDSDTILADNNITQTLSQTPISTVVTTAYNATWLEFDGVDDDVDVGNPDSINTTSNFSVSVWVNTTDFSTSTRDNIISKGTTGSFEWAIRLDESGNFSMVVHTDVGGNYYTMNTLTTSMIGQWQQAGMTVEEGVAAIGFVNGTSAVTDSTSGGTRETDNNADILLGSRETIGSDTRFNGSIDEVRIYNRTLATWEMRAIYNESRYHLNLGKRIPILAYHQVRDDTLEVGTIINRTMFRSQLDYLNNSGFQTITLTDYFNWTQDRFTMPNKPVILVFDDGWLNVITNATTMMDEYGYIGVASIITDLVGDSAGGGGGRMDWDDIQNLSDKGWEIASHSINATHLTDLAPDDIIKAFNDSKNSIEGNISVIPISFIYPGNEHNISLDAQCTSFYTLCTGDGTTDSNPKHSYKSSNLSGEVFRINILNSTTLPTTNITPYASLVDRYYGNVLWLDINENSGSVTVDKSGLENNGTINGAVYTNDDNTITLVNDIDYDASSSTDFTILNDIYSWSELNASYTYTTETGSSSTSVLRTTGIFIGLIFLIILIIPILRRLEVL